MGVYRTAVGSPWQETQHLTVTLVDVEGVPGGISVGSVSVTGIGTGADPAAAAGGANGELVPQAKRTNIELGEINARLGSKGSFCYYRVGTGNVQAGWADVSYDNAGSISGVNIYDSAGALVAGSPTFAVPDAAAASSAGGAVAVTYSVNGGATGLSGAWDSSNNQVYPIDGSPAIALGAGAGQAVITSVAPDDSITTVSPYSSFFTTASGIIKNAPGNLRSLVASHTNAAKRYIQIFNLATAPPAGATPMFSFPMAGSSATSDSGFVVDENFLDGNGHAFSVGIAWGYSSTGPTFTPATGTEVMVNGRFT